MQENDVLLIKISDISSIPIQNDNNKKKQKQIAKKYLRASFKGLKYNKVMFIYS